MIRQGMTANDVRAAIGSDFPRVNLTELRSMISQERVRQQNVDVITAANKGQFANLGKMLGCADPSRPVRFSITITFKDPATGAIRDYTTTADVVGSNRLGELLNRAIAVVVEQARVHYQVPDITWRDTTGVGSFRLDYVECL
jgi:hypothetical protein